MGLFGIGTHNNARIAQGLDYENFRSLALENDKIDCLQKTAPGDSAAAEALRQVFAQKIDSQSTRLPAEIIRGDTKSFSKLYYNTFICKEMKRIALGGRPTLADLLANANLDIRFADGKVLSRDFETARNELAQCVTKQPDAIYDKLDAKAKNKVHLMMAVLSLQLAQQVQQVVGLAIALDAKAPAFTFDPREDVPTKLSFTIQPGRFGAVEFQFRGTDEPKCLHANGGAYDLKPGLKLHTAATLHFEPEEIDRIAELDFTQYDETAVDNLLAGNEAKTDQALANAILEPFRLQVSTAAVVNAEI